MAGEPETSSPISVLQLVQLTELGIPSEQVSCARVSLGVDGTVCARHTDAAAPHRSRVSLVDPRRPAERRSWPVGHVDSAVANPCRPLVALRGVRRGERAAGEPVPRDAGRGVLGLAGPRHALPGHRRRRAALGCAARGGARGGVLAARQAAWRRARGLPGRPGGTVAGAHRALPRPDGLRPGPHAALLAPHAPRPGDRGAGRGARRAGALRQPRALRAARRRPAPRRRSQGQGARGGAGTAPPGELGAHEPLGQPALPAHRGARLPRQRAGAVPAGSGAGAQQIRAAVRGGRGHGGRALLPAHRHAHRVRLRAGPPHPRHPRRQPQRPGAVHLREGGGAPSLRAAPRPAVHHPAPPARLPQGLGSEDHGRVTLAAPVRPGHPPAVPSCDPRGVVAIRGALLHEGALRDTDARSCRTPAP